MFRGLRGEVGPQRMACDEAIEELSRGGLLRMSGVVDSPVYKSRAEPTVKRTSAVWDSSSTTNMRATRTDAQNLNKSMVDSGHHALKKR
jgi:hypothetical protein